jgi:hypothetical protein
LDPDSTQTARDRQLIHHRRTGDLLEVLIFSQHPALSSPPAITTNLVYGETNRRLAYLRPERFAFWLELRPPHTQFYEASARIVLTL